MGSPRGGFRRSPTTPARPSRSTRRPSEGRVCGDQPAHDDTGKEEQQRQVGKLGDRDAIARSIAEGPIERRSELARQRTAPGGLLDIVGHCVFHFKSGRSDSTLCVHRPSSVTKVVKALRAARGSLTGMAHAVQQARVERTIDMPSAVRSTEV